MKIGTIAIMGRPNVGKSTFLNCALSKKISIVSPRAQTTRDSICGILTEKDRQYVFVDTPGIYYGDGKLESHMRRAAFGSSRGVDAILYFLDASSDSLDQDLKIVSSIKTDSPLLFVLNKIDLIKVEKAREIEEKVKIAYPNFLVIEASFKENFGIKEVKTALEPYLTEGEPLYPKDYLTDKDREYQAKEVIREKLLHFLFDEIPHQSAVRIDEFTKEGGGYNISATIIVEKKAHKGIVIGQGGQMIKKISMSSRHELERMWHEHVTHLTIEVEAIPGWRNSPKALMDLGYNDK